MEPVSLAVLALVVTLTLIGLRVPIAYALGLSASAGLLVYFGWRPGGEFALERALVPTLSLIGNTTFEFVHNYPLSMIPLFIGVGHLAYHAGITTDLYDAMHVWLRRLPGGLAIASIVGCGGFSAITGSSVACASAMGRIAVPEMLRHGYAPSLATGSVAAGGTLGSLIPPSLLFVIYSIFTEESIRLLFLAGVLPGVLSLAGYVITVCVWAKLRPSDAPRAMDSAGPATANLILVWRIWPALLLLCTVVIGIYQGFFTPTEAAAVSMAMVLVIGVVRGKLDLTTIRISLHETAVQTAAIFLIAIGAKIFVAFISLTRIAPDLLSSIQNSGASVTTVLICLVLVYLVLGMFLDSIGILVLTLPFVVPLIEGYGLNLIWFGVVVIKLLEVGLITPPVGLNVFVIKSISPRAVTLESIFKGVGWFLVLDMLLVAALVAYPSISLLIPYSAK